MNVLAKILKVVGVLILLLACCLLIVYARTAAEDGPGSLTGIAVVGCLGLGMLALGSLCGWVKA